MSIKGFLPSQCGKSEVAAFEAWPETHSIAATLQLHEIVSLYISCALLCFLWIFKTHWWCCKYVALSNKRGKQGFDSTPPVQFVTHNIREREASESCPFWAVLIYLCVCAHTQLRMKCDCARKSMCDNIIQMPHHTLGLCQSHPMKHTEQMLIVKS